MSTSMSDKVDQLRKVLGAGSDSALAALLGLERSTIAQWRRREQVPARYRVFIEGGAPKTVESFVRRSDRRSVYGDGHGRYILSAALGVIPLHTLDFGEELSPGNLGWARESRVMSVVRIILAVCKQLFDRERCETDDEYIKLMEALKSEPVRGQIALALVRAAVGEV